MKEKNSMSRKQAKNIVPTRGRIFEGFVTKKFPKRVVIEFERTVYIPKFERYMKKTTRLHARLPENMNVNVGDLVKVRESRPLSKLIHFIVVEKLTTANSQGGIEKK